jgi:hypothetical protein
VSQRELDAFGEPQLQIAGLRVWVHGRQFPNAMDYWDGNRMRVTAYCLYPDSQVRTHGAIIHLGELVGLLRECESLYKSVKGKAALKCIEPNIRVALEAEWNGAIKVHIDITPDQMTERHSFDDSIDQTYLPRIIGDCESILAAYPIREPGAGSHAKGDA